MNKKIKIEISDNPDSKGLYDLTVSYHHDHKPCTVKKLNRGRIKKTYGDEEIVDEVKNYKVTEDWLNSDHLRDLHQQVSNIGCDGKKDTRPIPTGSGCTEV